MVDNYASLFACNCSARAQNRSKCDLHLQKGCGGILKSFNSGAPFHIFFILLLFQTLLYKSTAKMGEKFCVSPQTLCISKLMFSCSVCYFSDVVCILFFFTFSSMSLFHVFHKHIHSPCLRGIYVCFWAGKARYLSSTSSSLK